MNILGIETSGKSNGVALVRDEIVLGEKKLPKEISTSKGLLGLIDCFLKDNNYTISKVDGIAVTIGPGAFTSLRVGVSIVRGLAWTVNKPVVGINTLDALARQLAVNNALICPILDAKQGEVYAALYKWQNGTLIKLSEDLLITPAELVSMINEKVYFTGSGASVFKEQIKALLGELAVFAEETYNCLQATTVAKWGYNQFKLGKGLSPLKLIPDYLRRPAAEVKATK